MLPAIGYAVKAPLKRGVWKFNEGAGNVITDQTGHGNDITGSGDPTWVKVEIPKIN